MTNLEHTIDISDHIIDLSYQDTFEALDARLVVNVADILNTSCVQLYLNEPNNKEAILLQEIVTNDSPEDNLAMTSIPLFMTSGQRLTLLLNKELNDDEQIALVKLITAFSNLHEHLTRSNKDQLTSLKNRRSFNLEYLSLLKQVSDSPSDNTMIIAVLDIDHFKQVNDSFGHIIGDETLVTFANVMKAFFKRDEYLYRFGGEEFIVLLKDVTPIEAEILLEQLRIEIANYPFPQIGHKTVSIGYTSIREGEDSALLFERADLALYQAKHSGRNCIKHYDKLVEEGTIEPIDKRSGDVELF